MSIKNVNKYEKALDKTLHAERDKTYYRELLFHFISAYYPYISQRYYDENYIPAQMMVDILGKMKEALETDKRSSLTPKPAGLLRAFIQWADIQLELYYELDCDDNVVFNVQGP